MGDHAASITYGTEGVMHGFNSIMLADENNDPAPVYSNASGLDYPAAGPEHALLHDLGRVRYTTVGDEDAIEALFLLSRHEGIIPAIESAHAVAALAKMTFRPDDIVVLTVSGRGDKDVETYLKNKEMAKEYGDF